MCLFALCSLQMPQTLDKFFSIPATRPTPAPTHEHIVWAVLVFRHQDRLVGKARQLPYNLAQKAETKLRDTQPQKQLWHLVDAARATTANQWRFLPHFLHAMGSIIKGTHGVQRAPREASSLGDTYRLVFLVGLMSLAPPDPCQSPLQLPQPPPSGVASPAPSTSSSLGCTTPRSATKRLAADDDFVTPKRKRYTLWWIFGRP